MTVDAATFRLSFETDLGDEAIDALIADASAAIEERVGTAGDDQDIVLTVRGSDQYIFLPQPVTGEDQITSIVERYGNDEATLEADQWRLIGKRQIERIVGGGNLNPELWGYNFADNDVEFQVIITYTPNVSTSRKDRVIIDLVKLAIQYQGLQNEHAGDYSSSSFDYQEERKKLISELVPRLRFA